MPLPALYLDIRVDSACVNSSFEPVFLDDRGCILQSCKVDNKGCAKTFSNAGFCLALSAAGQEKMIASSNKRHKQQQRC